MEDPASSEFPLEQGVCRLGDALHSGSYGVFAKHLRQSFRNLFFCSASDVGPDIAMAHCKRRIPWDMDLEPSGFGFRPSHPGRQVSVQMPLRHSWTTVRLTSLGYDQPSLHDLLKAYEDRHPEGEMFRSHRAGPKHLPRFVACQAPCKGQLPLARVQEQAARPPSARILNIRETPQSRTAPSWPAAFGCLHILAAYGRRSWLCPTSRLSPRKLMERIHHAVEDTAVAPVAK